MEAAYADVADILNAIYFQSLVLTPEEEALAEVIAIANEINAPITQFALILARRGVWVKGNIQRRGGSLTKCSYILIHRLLKIYYFTYRLSFFHCPR